MVFLMFNFLLMPISPFAEQPKVYTDSDLEKYKSGFEDDTHQYNQRAFENPRQQEIIENYQKDIDSTSKLRQMDIEKQKRIEAERQRKIDECVAKAQAMIEESTKTRKRAGAEAKLRAGEALLDSCYGRSSSTSHDSAEPVIHIGGPNFIDTSTGRVRNCPGAMGRPNIDINRDCLPE